jgi:hypothetical protein
VNDDLPGSLNRFAAELEFAIRRELGPRRDHRLVRLFRARPRLLAGTTIGAAGTGAVLAIVLSAAGSSPAFAVTRNSDGSYSVTLRSLSAIPAANRTLAKMGLRAALVQRPAHCPARRPPLRARIPAPIPAPSQPRHRRIPPTPRPRHRRIPAPIPTPTSVHLRVPVCGPAPVPAGS